MKHGSAEGGKSDKSLTRKSSFAIVWDNSWDVWNGALKFSEVRVRPENATFLVAL